MLLLTEWLGSFEAALTENEAILESRLPSWQPHALLSNVGLEVLTQIKYDSSYRWKAIL